MIAEIDRGLAMIDQRFAELAANGDQRANHFLESLTRARTELDTLAAQAGTQDGAIESLSERTNRLRENIDRLVSEIRDGVGTAIGEAQGALTGWWRAHRAFGRKSAGSAKLRSKQATAWHRPTARSPISRTASANISQRSTAAWTMPGEARRTRGRHGSGRARSCEPQCRNGPAARQRAGPSQGSCGARSRACPRGH